MKRALVLCPGRGSYSRDTLGSLVDRGGPALHAVEACRARHDRRGIRVIDSMDRFSGRWHVAGEHASLLTAAVSWTDLEELDQDRVEIVAVCGNSMGFYTALAVAGALDLDSGAELIETMASYQAGNVIGGQVVWPLCDDEWRMDSARRDRLDAIVAQTPDLFWSIRLGGQAVLGGTGAALSAARAQLGEEVRGAHSYPLRLPLHSAFHTPLLRGASGRAQTDLAGLPWRAPRVPLVDGRGHIWRPFHTDPLALGAYTLGHQVTEAFDFTAMVRSALGDHAPDIVILPGPGGGLGGAVAQVMIDMGWQDLRSRTDFVARQKRDPVLISMARPEQRAQVVAPR